METVGAHTESVGSTSTCTYTYVFFIKKRKDGGFVCTCVDDTMRFNDDDGLLAFPWFECYMVLAFLERFPKFLVRKYCLATQKKAGLQARTTDTRLGCIHIIAGLLSRHTFPPRCWYILLSPKTEPTHHAPSNYMANCDGTKTKPCDFSAARVY